MSTYSAWNNTTGERNHSNRYRLPFDLGTIGREKYSICRFEINELVPNYEHRFAYIHEQGVQSTQVRVKHVRGNNIFGELLEETSIIRKTGDNITSRHSRQTLFPFRVCQVIEGDIRGESLNHASLLELNARMQYNWFVKLSQMFMQHNVLTRSLNHNYLHCWDTNCCGFWSEIERRTSFVSKIRPLLPICMF